MKKSTIVLAILTVAAVMWFATTARAEAPQITAEIWPFYPADGQCHIAGKVKANFNYGSIDIIDWEAGCIIESIPGAKADLGNCSASGVDFASHVPVNAFSFNITVKEFIYRSTISLRAYDQEGNWVASTPMFRRTLFRWAPEIFSIQSIPEGCGLSSVAITYEFHPLYGNAAPADGKSCKVIVNGYTFDSAIFSSGGKQLCMILVPREVFAENFLGENYTRFEVGYVSNGVSLSYPAENWDPPAYLGEAAGPWEVQ